MHPHQCFCWPATYTFSPPMTHLLCTQTTSIDPAAHCPDTFHVCSYSTSLDGSAKTEELRLLLSGFDCHFRHMLLWFCFLKRRGIIRLESYISNGHLHQMEGANTYILIPSRPSFSDVSTLPPCLQPFLYCLPMAANSFSSSFWYYFSSWEGRGVVPAPAITDVNHLGWLIALLMCGFLRGLLRGQTSSSYWGVSSAISSE